MMQLSSNTPGKFKDNKHIGGDNDYMKFTNGFGSTAATNNFLQTQKNNHHFNPLGGGSGKFSGRNTSHDASAAK